MENVSKRRNNGHTHYIMTKSGKGTTAQRRRPLSAEITGRKKNHRDNKYTWVDN